jgi:hypothetical protein
MAKKKQPKSKKKADGSISSGEIPKQSSKKKKAHFSSLPSLSLPGKKIHPRQVIPPVAKGKHVPDNTSSFPIDPE